MAREAINQVQLGDDSYTLHPQRIGRISRKIEALVSAFGNGPNDVQTEVTGTLYEALQVFIPDLAPRWKLSGYPNADAWAAVEAHQAAVSAARDTYAAEQLEDAEAVWDELSAAQQARYVQPAELDDFEDPYDEAADASPTPPEILDAVEAIFRIHGGDRLTRLLGKFLTPEMIRGQLERLRVESNLRRSQRLQQQIGESDPTPSTTTEPTPTASTGSPSPESSTS